VHTLFVASNVARCALLPLAASWVQAAARSRWTPRLAGRTTVSYGAATFLVGGTNGTAAFNDVWQTKDGSMWALINANASFGPRTGACLIAYGDSVMMLLGGQKRLGGGAVQYLHDVWTSVDGCEWRCCGRRIRGVFATT